MNARSAGLPFAVALTAVIAAVAWQYADMRHHQLEHVAEYQRYGRALVDAAESVVLRECRGGRFVPGDLTTALDETRRRFDLEWLAVRTASGDAVASSGVRPGEVESRSSFEKPFEPKAARPLGRGPRWASEAVTAALPEAALTVSLVMPTAGLDARLADDRDRAIVTAAALVAAIGLLAGSFWLRTRAANLHAELAESRVRLAGLETLRRLGAGLAHETRNPLGVVRGFAERIASGRMPPEQLAPAARSIVEETDRTVARLDEFLLLSRPAELRRTRVRVGPLFEELATLLRPDLDDAGAALTSRCGDQELLADHDQIRRLLMNLVLNAIRAVGAGVGGQIELACEVSDHGVRISVSDDGEGVPEALRATLFEPYVTGRSGGTGLGLSIARRIALDHGFELRYEPRAPRGTCMILEAPVP